MELNFKIDEINKKRIILNETLETRINETAKDIVFRIRNVNFETSGRILIFDEIEKINTVSIGENTYSNLKYISNETYFHNVKIEGTENIKMVEDFVITFSKSEVI